MMIILGTSLVTHATENCYFIITLTDNCGGNPWIGYYDVEISILANGSTVGTSVAQNVIAGGPNCWLFVFNIDPLVSDKVYTINVVAAERHGGSCYTLLNQAYTTPCYFNDMEACSTTPYSISITI